MHYPLLDLFRYLAAALVAFGHFNLFYYSNTSFEFLTIVSVEFFFVLSGFVLAPQIDKVTQSQSYTFLKIFLFRRWMRTVPSYLAALTCAALMFGYGDWQNFLSFAVYVQNFFSDDSERNFFSVGWSLSIEEWFYIYFPFVMMLFYRFAPSVRASLGFCLGIIVLFMVLRLAFANPSDWGEDVRRVVIFRLDAIVYGYLAYKVLDKVPAALSVIATLTGAASLVTLSLHNELLSTHTVIQNLFFPLCGITFSALIITLTKISASNHYLKLACKWLGHMSYPIYLFHIIVIGLVSKMSADINGFLVFAASLNLLALFFYYFFERPILASRPNYPKTQTGD